MNISDRNVIHCDVAWVTNRISISNGLTNAEARCHIRRFLDRKPWGGISDINARLERIPGGI